MMKLFSFSHNKEKDFLALDFGSSSIKGLIFNRAGDKINLKKCYASEISQFGVFSAKDFQADVIRKALQNVFAALLNDKKPSDFKTIISFPSNVLRTVVLDISLKRDNPEIKISHQEESKMREEIIHLAGKKLFQFLQNKQGQDASAFQIVKSRIIEKKISGYRVSTLFGFRGEELDFKVLLVFGFSSHLNFIQQLVKDFDFSDFTIGHEIEGLMAIRKLLGGYKVFIDAGSHSSKIFVFNDVLETTSEVPMNGEDFTKELSSKLGIGRQQAEELSAGFVSGQISEQASIKIQEVIGPIYNKWQERLDEALKKERKIIRGEKAFLIFGGYSGILSFLSQRSAQKENSDTIILNILNIDKLPVENVAILGKDLKYVPVVLLGLTKLNSK